jgi:DNA-binding response OmpR family regulator
MTEPGSILIVDDEPNVRLMLQTALESVGYHVMQAENGEAALKRLGDSEVDMILLDLQMPRMSGMELLRRLRAARDPTPVVFLSAHGSIPDAVEAMKLGAIDFLTKPITPDALRRVVAEVIAREVAAPAPEQPVAPAPTLDREQLAVDLANAKRSLNRGQFDDAESLLRQIITRRPNSSEAHELLDRLETLKRREAGGSFSILRDWFPGGKLRRKPMKEPKR